MKCYKNVMNNIEVFKNDRFGEVRTIVIDNEPWFVAKDVCEVLEISNSRGAISSLDDDEKGVANTDTLGGKQEMSIINESGLYSLVLRSRKPEAKIFRKWITSEVIPSIRKNEVYMTPAAIEKTLNNPDFIIQLATRLKEEQLKTATLQNKIELDAPKVEFFDAVADSKDAIDIGTASKVLGIKGLGRNNLFELLRDEKILMNNNQPYQKYVDAGWFRIVEQKFSKPDGSTCINIKTLVYQKGLDAIRKVVSDHDCKE